LAALNTATGEAAGQLNRRHRAVGFKEFLVRADREVPTGLDVHMICDNASTHKAPAIQRWLTTHPRFHVHFTPAGSSWLNQVVRWFVLLTGNQAQRGSHRKVQVLQKDIRDWTKTWNEDPRPFVWTKTADRSRPSAAALAPHGGSAGTPSGTRQAGFGL
jgi:transposase